MQQHASQPTFYGYDLETATADVGTYIPVIEFGRCGFDEAMEPHPLPEYAMTSHYGVHYASPGAAAAHGMQPTAAHGSPMSLARAIAARLRADAMRGSATTRLFGYNNVIFDDKVMRRFLWANGQSPYLADSVFDQPPLDLFHMAIFAQATGSRTLNFMTSKRGSPELSLGKIAEANNISVEGNLHEALTDVRVSAALAAYVIENDPDLWARYQETANQAQTRHMFAAGESISALGAHMYGVYRTPLLPVCPHPHRSKYHIAIKLDNPARLKKFLSLSEENLQGFYGKPPAERPKGFQGKDGGNIPISRLNPSSLYIPGLEYVSESKRGKIAESKEYLATLTDGDIEQRLLLAFSDPEYRQPKEFEPVEDNYYGINLSRDDHSLRAQLSEAIESNPGSVNIFEEGSRFSGHRDIHTGLLSLWQGDALCGRHLAAGEDHMARRAIIEFAETAPRATEHTRRADAMRLYAHHCAQRFADTDCNFFDPVERAEEDLAALQIKKPQRYYDNIDAVEHVMAHNNLIRGFTQWLAEYAETLAHERNASTPGSDLEPPADQDSLPY